MSDPNAQSPHEPTNQPAPPAGGSAPTGSQPLAPAQDRQWASFAHLGGILAIIPPLIIWLIFKDRGSLTNQEGKESVNYQITIVLAWIVVSILNVILVFIPFIGAILSLLLTLAVLAAQIVFPILGFVKVNGGGTYRYPFALRLIK